MIPDVYRENNTAKQSNWLLKIEEAVGTSDSNIAKYTLLALKNGLNTGNTETLNAILAQVNEMKPVDSIERCLLIQMFLTAHNAIWNMHDHSFLLNEHKGDMSISIKLMRLFTQQCEALRRLRGIESTQKITINHISTSGNTMVGDVINS